MSPLPWSVVEENCGNGWNIRDANYQIIAHTHSREGVKPITPQTARANADAIVAAVNAGALHEEESNRG